MKIKRSITANSKTRQTHVHVAIELSLKVTASPGIRISMRRAQDRRWESAVAFGISLAAEQYPQGGTQLGIDVMVFYVEHQHIGPTAAAVALVASQCAFSGLGLPDTLVPSFDETHGCVQIPLWE